MGRLRGTHRALPVAILNSITNTTLRDALNIAYHHVALQDMLAMLKSQNLHPVVVLQDTASVATDVRHMEGAPKRKCCSYNKHTASSLSVGGRASTGDETAVCAHPALQAILTLLCEASPLEGQKNQHDILGKWTFTTSYRTDASGKYNAPFGPTYSDHAVIIVQPLPRLPAANALTAADIDSSSSRFNSF